MKNAVHHLATNPLKILVCLIIAGLSIGLLTTPYYALAPLPGLGIILIILLGRYPQFGFYLIVFTIVLGAYRNKADWLIVFFLLIFLFSHLLVSKTVPENLKSKLWPLFLSFFTISLISAFLSKYPAEAFYNILLLTVGYVFFALTLFFVSPGGLRKILPSVIVWSVAICSFSAVIGYFFNVPYFAENVDAGGFKRGIGTSTDPNTLSLLIIFSIPFFVHLMFHTRGSIKQFILLVLLMINMIAMVTTFSRSGIMILFLTLIAAFLIHRKRLRPKLTGILISVVASGLVLLFLLIPASYFERLMSITGRDDRSIERRSSYLVVGWDAFKEHPLLGSGPGTFRDIFAASEYALKYEKEGKTKRRFAHNTYIEVFVGTGISGLSIFVYILFYALRDFSSARKGFERKGDNEMVSLVGTYRISFIFLLITLLTISNLYHKYLLLSLAVSQIALRSSQEDLPGVEDNETANHG